MSTEWKPGDVAVINKEYPSRELHGTVVVVQAVGTRGNQPMIRVLVPSDGRTWIVYTQDLSLP